MKKIVCIFLTILIIVLSTGCVYVKNREPEDIVKDFDKVIGDISQLQIDKTENLCGTRENKDNFTGTYKLDVKNETGRECVFGGASINNRRVKLSGNFKVDEGKVTIRVRLNEKVVEISSEDLEDFDEEFDFEGGSNYIIFIYEDFTGKLDLKSEYI